MGSEGPVVLPDRRLQSALGVGRPPRREEPPPPPRERVAGAATGPRRPTEEAGDADGTSRTGAREAGAAGRLTDAAPAPRELGADDHAPADPGLGLSS